MENFKPPGYEEMVKCPHNDSHLILKSRLQTHLVKCNKNHSGSGKQTCPFNTTHLINKNEYKKHIEICPDRASFDLYKYKIDCRPQGMQTSVDIEEPEQTVHIEATEDWSDYNVPTYNPRKYCDNAPVLRTKIGGTPSEKKAFRKAQEELFKKHANK